MSIDLIIYAAVTLMAAQGLFFALAPQRAAAFQRWQFTLFGAAESGPATYLFYRIVGVGSVAMAAFILIQFVSE